MPEDAATKPATKGPEEQNPASEIESKLPSEEEVQQEAADYYRKLTEASQRLTENARQLYDVSHGYAQEHPFGMMIGALVTGVVLGVLMGRD